jgi:hypothetical protein
MPKQSKGTLDEQRLRSDIANGRWVPRSYGSWFQCVRLSRKTREVVAMSKDEWPTLVECQDECKRLNFCEL